MEKINYSMTFNIAEVKELLKVDKKFILDCLYHFAEYFVYCQNSKSTGEKKFVVEDIRVFAYILLYWEAEPDFENIKYGLNSNSHFLDPINDFIAQITPIFIEPSVDNIGDFSASVIIGGMGSFVDIFELALSYKKSGDKLIILSLENDDKLLYFYPAIFCYRHSVELFLKSIIGGKILHHNLEKLFLKFEAIVFQKFNAKVPKNFREIILALHDFDPSSTSFRYGEEIPNDEHILDLFHFKNSMDSLENSFKIIRDKM